jgi:hypothetical protein
MVHLRSPVRSSPGPVRPDGSGSPWTFPLALPRFVTETAHWGGDEWNTHSSSRCYPLNHSYEATSCRTAADVILSSFPNLICRGFASRPLYLVFPPRNRGRYPPEEQCRHRPCGRTPAIRRQVWDGQPAPAARPPSRPPGCWAALSV